MFARSTEMGITRASDSGTSNKYGSHAFLYHHIDANEGSPKANFLGMEENIEVDKSNEQDKNVWEMYRFYMDMHCSGRYIIISLKDKVMYVAEDGLTDEINRLYSIPQVEHNKYYKKLENIDRCPNNRFKLIDGSQISEPFKSFLRVKLGINN